MLARTPARIESLPRSGLTVLSAMIFRLIGSLPDRSEMASELADSTVKLPEIDSRS